MDPLSGPKVSRRWESNRYDYSYTGELSKLEGLESALVAAGISLSTFIETTKEGSEVRLSFSVQPSYLRLRQALGLQTSFK